MKFRPHLISRLWRNFFLRNRPLCLVTLLFLLSLFCIDHFFFPFIGVNPLPAWVQDELFAHPHQKVAGVVGSCTAQEWGTTLLLEDALCQLGEERVSLKNLRVSLSDSTLYPPDTTLLLEGDLSPLEGARNPGGFDAKAYYACEDIYYSLKKAVVLRASHSPISLRRVLGELRNRFVQIFSLCAGSSAPFFDALVLGEKSLLTQEQKLRFQLSGIIHILAISGLHISLIGEGLRKLLARLRLGFYKRCLLSLFFVVSFGILTGGSVSTLRALTLFLLSTGAQLSGRCYDLPTALCVSALLILLPSPAYLYNASFLLSFGAVLSIGCLAPPLLRALERYLPTPSSPSYAIRLLKEGLAHVKELPLGGDRFYRLLKAGLDVLGPSPLHSLLFAFSSSLLVQLLTLPILLTFYGEVSLMGCLCNLVVLPTAGLALGSGLLTLLGGLFSIPLGKILILPGRGVFLLYDWLCGAATTFPFCTLVAGSPSPLQILIYYLFLSLSGLLFCRHAPEGEGDGSCGKRREKRRGKRERGKRKKTGMDLIAPLLLLISGLLFLCLHPHLDLRLTSLDIGQGDALVIETPQGRTYLSDGGSTSQSKIGTYQLIPYLKHMGISHLDGIFLSHTDEDHYNGIEELLTLKKQHLLSISISALYLPRWENPPEVWTQLKALASEAGVEVRTMGRGDQLQSGDLSLTALAPFPQATGEDPNADSLVLFLRYRSFTGLLTGDIGKPTELLLLPDLSPLTFLKVAHHGSNESSCEEFLLATRPKLGFISCALKNRYGHPGKRAVSRLQEAGCQLSYTMKNGALTCHTDGERVWVTTYLPE